MITATKVKNKELRYSSIIWIGDNFLLYTSGQHNEKQYICLYLLY